MMHEITKRQLAGLRLTGRPLVICDVDEVVVHFTRDFERYLDRRGLWLEAASLALHGNVRHLHGNGPAADELVTSLIDGFFTERTRHMEAIDGAIDSLLTISETADVVMLTNLPHEAGDDRRANLAEHGLPFPVVTNSGPKGPAISHLAASAGGSTVFIDDSPGFIKSAFEHAPHVHLVHFMHDERFSRHVAPIEYVSLRAAAWDEARPHILELIAR